MLVYLPMRDRGALMQIARDRVLIFSTPSISDLSQASSLLRTLIETPSSSSTAIESESERVSRRLWPPDYSSNPPRRLRIVAGGPLDNLAWSVLRWPGNTRPLVDTTVVEFVTFADGPDRRATQEPRFVYAMSASQRNDESTLTPLAFAGEELDRVGLVARQLSARWIVDSKATRRTVLDAMQMHDAWIHVAAHGVAKPDRIGYGGIWLDPDSSNDSVDLLSWIDVVQYGSKSDLVVLNACQLADAGAASRQGLSFANALSRAGAAHVVSALWSVSDAASATWIPAFYAAMTDGFAQDAAEALHRAQLDLRARRAFRHPFFWASLVEHTRMTVGIERDR